MSKSKYYCNLSFGASYRTTLFSDSMISSSFWSQINAFSKGSGPPKLHTAHASGTLTVRPCQGSKYTIRSFAAWEPPAIGVVNRLGALALKASVMTVLSQDLGQSLAHRSRVHHLKGKADPISAPPGVCPVDFLRYPSATDSDCQRDFFPLQRMKES